MIAGGGTAISDLAVLRDQPSLFGEVASTPTAWRTLEAVEASPTIFSSGASTCCGLGISPELNRNGFATPCCTPPASSPAPADERPPTDAAPNKLHPPPLTTTAPDLTAPLTPRGLR